MEPLPLSAREPLPLGEGNGGDISAQKKQMEDLSEANEDFSHPKPGIQQYLQLASMGHGNTDMDKHMGVDPHPMLPQDGQFDPVLNLLAHAAHPTENSPKGNDISKQIHYLAERGSKIAKDAGKKLDDDHVVVLDQNNQPRVIDAGDRK